MDKNIKSTLVEAIVCSPEDARIAEAAGAARLEVCSAIELGGLTPSLGMVRAIRKTTELPIMAMLRPRAGGFAYSAGEFSALESDVVAFLDVGVDGIVFGVLTKDGQVDRARCSSLLERIQGREAVFHRAFDAIQDPFEALEMLIELGVRRVLSSGKARSAFAGCELLGKLVNRAEGRIEVMAGGGIRADNACEIVRCTGVNAVHLGPMVRCEDRSLHLAELESTRYGADYLVASGDAIAKVVAALSNW